MQERSVASVILLSLLTCGIYWLYWVATVTNEIETTTQNKNESLPSGGTVVLLGIVTCGIYFIYWHYKVGQRIASLMEENAMPPTDNSLIYLILACLELSIVAAALIQSDLNRIAAARRDGISRPYRE